MKISHKINRFGISKMNVNKMNTQLDPYTICIDVKNGRNDFLKKSKKLLHHKQTQEQQQQQQNQTRIRMQINQNAQNSSFICSSVCIHRNELRRRRKYQ